MTEPTLLLTDGRTGERRPFAPADPARPTMYVCGPTVYDRAHLGNARSAVVFDVLARLLRHLHGGLLHVRNLTDVDDKILARAAEAGRPIREITEETTRWYHEDMAALGVRPPDREPRATGYVAEMVAMIEALAARGHAYAADGHAYFEVATDPGYGSLSGRVTEEQIAGARVAVAAAKRAPGDFVLWKPSAAGEPAWPGPALDGARLPDGRPGWHIECSAMIGALVGETVDVHGGGTDLLFPHHENERAQSECLHGAPLARWWVHNEMLRVEGAKMSKSLGNFLTVRDVLDRGVPGAAIRLVLMGAHYGRPLDWTDAAVEEALVRIHLWKRALGGAPAAPAAQVVEALAADLNTHAALERTDALAERALAGDAAAAGAFAGSLALLGFEALENDLPALAAAHRDAVEARLAERAAARAARDYARADAARAALVAAGVEVSDRPGGATDWSIGPRFDPAKLGA